MVATTLDATSTAEAGDFTIGSDTHPAATNRRAVAAIDILGVALGAALVFVAFWVPYLHNATITPLINHTRAQFRDFADAAPIFGFRDVHAGWGTPCAVVSAIAVVVWGPMLAQRLSWRGLLLCTWSASIAWAMALVLVDGWQRGFVTRLTGNDEYLHDVPYIVDIPAALRSFARRIPDYQTDSWTTHVSGHPPGAVLSFVWLDRIGLGGGAWAGAYCVAIGTSAGVAIIVTLRALGDEAMARRAAPFVVLAPTAIWIAVSADAMFAGVVAWGMALLALSATRTVRSPTIAAVGAGVLLGFGVYLSYGLTLMAVPGLAVLIVARTARPLIGVVVGAIAVAVAFTCAGFWWFDGYAMVKVRYYQGIATDRPFDYWVWANIASLICAVGLAVPAATARVATWSKLRSRSPVNIVVLACLVSVVFADLSTLSKAETERIWLPFEVWLLAAPALLPQASHRFWLALQAAAALVIAHLIFTNW